MKNLEVTAVVVCFLLGLLEVCILVMLLDTHRHLQEYQKLIFTQTQEATTKQMEAAQKTKENADRVEYILKLYNVPAH